jgi:membrane-bound lytic murein transglycosylase B
MNKKIITAVLVVFIAVNNPIGYSEANVAYAAPQGIETSAASEANIARTIESVAIPIKGLTSDQKAKIELTEYQNEIAEQNAQIAAQQAAMQAQEAAQAAQAAAQAVQARQEAAEKAASVELTSAVSHGGFDAVYQKAQTIYGVPWQILAAIHMVETGQSGNTTETSGAGAEGPMQFLPSTFEAYAQDGDGDGKALITDVYDSIYTAADYLASNGAASGDVTGAIYHYNHSYSYVEEVLSIARSYGYTG